MSFGLFKPRNEPPSKALIRLRRKSIRSNVGCAANASDLMDAVIGEKQKQKQKKIQSSFYLPYK